MQPTNRLEQLADHLDDLARTIRVNGAMPSRQVISGKQTVVCMKTENVRKDVEALVEILRRLGGLPAECRVPIEEVLQ